MQPIRKTQPWLLLALLLVLGLSGTINSTNSQPVDRFDNDIVSASVSCDDSSDGDNGDEGCHASFVAVALASSIQLTSKQFTDETAAPNFYQPAIRAPPPLSVS
ncbi:MAG: hypothetical protein HWE13_08660 [Gammaproteobacteria bacterium]|nr:hypothetical protein [Gammaproteobacteria bacterium]NVK88185.1 hypothetical protein [Gammaproteobacteria bacterium]